MASPGMWQSPTRIYLDKTRTRVVPEGSRDQGYVLVGAGGEIPIKDAERYGLVRVREGQVTAIDPAEVAERAPEPRSTGEVPARVVAAPAPGVAVEAAPPASPQVISTEQWSPNAGQDAGAAPHAEATTSESPRAPVQGKDEAPAKAADKPAKGK